MSTENKLHAAHYTFSHLLSSNERKFFSLFLWSIFFSKEKSQVDTLEKVETVACCVKSIPSYKLFVEVILCGRNFFWPTKIGDGHTFENWFKINTKQMQKVNRFEHSFETKIVIW